MTWHYESFYFGHGGWPDGATWRLRGEQKELWMAYGILQDDLAACQALWEQHRTSADSEPSAKPQGDDGYWAFGWWRSFDAPTTARIYERDVQDGWGEPTPLQPDKGSTPLAL